MLNKLSNKWNTGSLICKHNIASYTLCIAITFREYHSGGLMENTHNLLWNYIEYKMYKF